MTEPSLGFTAPPTVYAAHRAEVMQEQRRLSGSMWRVLARLQRGPATGPELNAICYRYTGRMSDLRLHHGYQIAKEHLGGAVWLYTLVGGPP